MKQLPESIALDKAVNSQNIYEGELSLSSLKRLSGSLASEDGIVNFTLKFRKAWKILGQVELTVKAELPLRCQISEKVFMYPVDVRSKIGFIESLKDEELMASEMEAAIVENGSIYPVDLIEDELILAMPYVPISPEESEKKEKTHNIAAPSKEEEEKLNPFSVLKNLK